MRGTPQQIIDKYLALARDAQLGNDRVAEQNFLQHAEHYARLLGEAQRDMAREQESRQQSQGQPDGGGNQHGGQGNGGQANGSDRQGGQRGRDQDRGERDTGGRVSDALSTARQDDADEGPGLVETPEARQRAAPMMPDMPQPAEAEEAGGKKPARAPRGPRKPRGKRAGPEEGGEATKSDGGNGDSTADAAE
ncbi:hypothetical protein DEA8626_01590 [Defluviimonas aquaemixtae]|uniref:DUF4167 domain-containing protein n=1 Tax=Albidovulum aquaemixtae TaxID=1542388 RepID=A0A2R8B6B4_9RHOB|nr:hypothetical protein DEA8626_01590 [Defluviimonas aquaemixtae]